MLTAALTPLSYLVINFAFAKFLVKDYEISVKILLIPAIIMSAMTALYYILLPYILIRYVMVVAGALILGGYCWKKYKDGTFSKMFR